jgi:hypothetical protein
MMSGKTRTRTGTILMRIWQRGRSLGRPRRYGMNQRLLFRKERSWYSITQPIR